MVDVAHCQTPRCCRVHRLEHQFIKADLSTTTEQPLNSSSRVTKLLPAEVSDLQNLHEASRGGSWLVLVGGEHGGLMRPDANNTRPGPYLAGHCSLQWVGITYSRLVRFFGRDRVIVIAQLAETLDWLRAASASEAAAERLAGRASLLPMLRRRLADTERDCAQLIAEGGADYDRNDVNAATVLRVLTGDASPSPLFPGRSVTEEAPADPRVVPKLGVGAVVVVFVSHGNVHPAGEKSANHEWYLHLPHPVAPEEDSLYDVVSHHGFDSTDPFPEWDWGGPKFRWKLYSQMLFRAYHSVLERTPRRRLVLLHQFCLSGGAIEFMRRPAYRTYCGTELWPIYAIVTAGRFEPALGDFVGFWTNEFSKALDEGGHRTLADVYASAERSYWEANKEMQKFNASVVLADADNTNPLTVGQVGSAAGIDAWAMRSMGEVPVGHLFSCYSKLCSSSMESVPFSVCMDSSAESSFPKSHQKPPLADVVEELAGVAPPSSKERLENICPGEGPPR
eukprot:TRINITY_DN23399_c0_g1_i1.p1 TRINITY_DN23399_c0_g1~~TRINITY_DN23399_c0_g1_i1.p1  ORF type:complete len:507 (+),score=64.64 TRINITY_DN23399_c0_g1_i1:98-1618(+)